MRDYKIALWIAGIGLAFAAVFGAVRSCNNYSIVDRPNLTSSSRATGIINFADKIEYTRLKDGSEEILIRDGNRLVRYQNFDRDSLVDRIRIDKFRTRDVLCLENILVRQSDFDGNEEEFRQADAMLAQEREAYAGYGNK